ncbi:hypothetical protein LJR098_001098 [Rhizobium sp. LjRoot98]|uniref:RNA ligase family protein n=1 Tax=Rhizobium sp. LjRoot98 TaxID=3342345 RepID=UPI003ECDC42F
MIKYPSIDQFRNAIHTVQKLTRSQFGKRDASGELIESQPRTWTFPPVEFTGTVKLHGTNAAVVVKDGNVSYQSRNRILTPDDDNMGFATWASQHEDDWKKLAKQFADWGQTNPGYVSPTGVAIFGEWIGQNIQIGVAISELSKRFVIFEIVATDGTPLHINRIHPSCDIYRLPADTYLITDFPTWTMTIDMENPHLSQNALVDITNAVEAECPVGKAFGISGIGEGVVWSADVSGHRIRFKVKGEKHSTYKVKTLASISTESIDTIKEFVDRALSDTRLNQGLDFLREHGLAIDVTSTGDYIRWVIGDVFKEEADTIAANCLVDAEVRRRIGSAAAQRFKNRIWTDPETDAA